MNPWRRSLPPNPQLETQAFLYAMYHDHPMLPAVEDSVDTSILSTRRVTSWPETRFAGLQLQSQGQGVQEQLSGARRLIILHALQIAVKKSNEFRAKLSYFFLSAAFRSETKCSVRELNNRICFTMVAFAPFSLALWQSDKSWLKNWWIQSQSENNTHKNMYF